MSPELLQHLHELDRLGHEFPPDLDFRRVWDEIFAQKTVLERLLNCSLQTSDGQDMAAIGGFHHAEPGYSNKPNETIFNMTVSIRFSNFGRMFTINGGELSRYTEQIPAVIEHLTRSGFNYVSSVDLAAPYVGIYGGGEDTWFDRFFGYL